jgi:hypothetical protein
MARAETSAQRAPVPADTFAPTSVLNAVKAPPVLSSLTLSDDYVERIRPGLQELGFSVDHDHLDQAEGKETIEFWFTVVENGAKRFLLQLDDEVLTVFSRVNKLALGEVRDLFKGKYRHGTTLYIFHESTPHGSYLVLMEGQWRETHRIAVKFIPLSQLRDFDDDMPLEKQMDYLKVRLDLADQPAGPEKKLPASEISPDERKKLAKILANLPVFRDDGVRGRRALVHSADLRDIAESYDFEGGPWMVAYSLIVDLPSQGLGLLLKRMGELPELSDAEREYIADVLEDYDFA